MQMVQQTQPVVSIKGIRDGILMALGPGDFELTLDELTLELESKQEFLRGSRIALEVGDRHLAREELARVQELLADRGMALWTVLSETDETKQAARELGLATRLPGSNVDLDGNELRKPPVEAGTLDTDQVDQATVDGSNSILLRETLRSGRSIFHEGHVVVIGDVNPGAEIIAGGDVVVWGKLRGLVHAGALGDTSAVICALELIPTQLRIADQIAVSPHDQRRQAVPEKVSLYEGQIVAESWNTKR